MLEAYKRPQRIATLLTNYKIITNKNNAVKGSSHLYEKCV